MAESQSQIDTQGGTAGGQAGGTKQPPRSYRILLLDKGDEGAEKLWVDFSYHPGATQESAIKAARAKHPELRSALADGQPVLAIAEGNFDPQIVGIETIERETFRKVKV